MTLHFASPPFKTSQCEFIPPFLLNHHPASFTFFHYLDAMLMVIIIIIF